MREMERAHKTEMNATLARLDEAKDDLAESITALAASTAREANLTAALESCSGDEGETSSPFPDENLPWTDCMDPCETSGQAFCSNFNVTRTVGKELVNLQCSNSIEMQMFFFRMGMNMDGFMAMEHARNAMMAVYWSDGSTTHRNPSECRCQWRSM